jgi:hypothetical protein
MNSVGAATAFSLSAIAGVLSVRFTRARCHRSPAPQKAQPIISNADMATLDRDGFVVLRNFFDAGTIATLQEGAQQLTDGFLDSIATLQEGDEGAPLDRCSGIRHDLRLEEILRRNEGVEEKVPILYRPELHDIPHVYSLFYHPKLVAAARQVLRGAAALRLFPNYSARAKLPRVHAHRVLWHQDSGLSPSGDVNDAPVAEREAAFGPHSLLNCWTSLVPVRRHNGCMLMVPGSHKRGCVRHVRESTMREGGAVETSGAAEIAQYGSTIDPVEVQAEVDRAEPIAIETDPGDLVLFTNHTFHCGLPNNAERGTPGVVRWSLDWRYQDAAQSTHRPQNGHLVYSSDCPEAVCPDADSWMALSLQ